MEDVEGGKKKRRDRQPEIMTEIIYILISIMNFLSLKIMMI